jgi:putative transposase
MVKMEKELRRRRWIIRRKLKGWTNKKIASHLRTNKRTVQRWWKLYKDSSWEGLQIKSRRPHSVYRTSDKIVKEVLRIRKKEGYGPNKIEGLLKNKGVSIGHNTIYRIICSNGLNRPIKTPRRIMGKTRFERKHSNSLWQADFKHVDHGYMISFLDDHSRFIAGSSINPAMTTEDALRLLERCIKKYTTPIQILTDRGTQFWNNRGEKPTEFTQFCMDNEIQHIVASVRRPTTTGKVERWHRTYDEEHHKFLTLSTFVRHYNYERPHQSLSYKCPADIYFRDRVTHLGG